MNPLITKFMPARAVPVLNRYTLCICFVSQGMTLPILLSLFSPQTFFSRRSGPQVPMCEPFWGPWWVAWAKVSNNNECLFVRTVFGGQLKLFLLYGKSTLGEIFSNHASECVRRRGDCQAPGEISHTQHTHRKLSYLLQLS